MGAYEYLWLNPKASVKSIAELFANNSGALASEIVDEATARDTAKQAIKLLESANIHRFGLRMHQTYQYPSGLLDAAYPVRFLYFLGHWDLIEHPKTIAVIGSRNATPGRIRRTQKLVQQLVDRDYTIVSGLAAGIDATAHEAAIKCGGSTIAVIGTPISDCYPKQNQKLQEKIAREHLLISQVPILRYRQQDWRFNRYFFPERNKTMSALTAATVIVEASELSGTLVQARAALQQGRKLFILDSCFQNPDISWPAKYEKQGAIRVKSVEDILDGLGAS
jgi:DNA processing protein